MLINISNARWFRCLHLKDQNGNQTAKKLQSFAKAGLYQPKIVSHLQTYRTVWLFEQEKLKKWIERD